MGKALESNSMAKAVTQTLQSQGYEGADAGEAHAQRTKNPTSTDDDDSSNDDEVTDVTVPAVVATQSFAGVTVAQASEPSFQKTVLAAVADKLDVKEGDVTITSTAASKNGKDVVVEYTVTGEYASHTTILPSPCSNSSLS